MRVFFVLVIVTASILTLAACRRSAAVAQVDPNSPVEVVIPEHGAYTGAFMDFGDAEDDVTLETIEEFEEMVGKHRVVELLGRTKFSGGQSECHLATWFAAACFLVAVGQAVRGRPPAGQVQLD
jgi:hypothetical protein